MWFDLLLLSDSNSQRLRHKSFAFIFHRDYGNTFVCCFRTPSTPVKASVNNNNEMKKEK